MSIRFSLSHPRLPQNMHRFYNALATIQRFLRYDNDPTTNRPIPVYDVTQDVRCYYELNQSGQEIRRNDGTIVQEGYNFMFEGLIALDTRDSVRMLGVRFDVIMSNFDPTNRFTFAIMERVQPNGNPI